jgi:predicted PurR-regulated permease PerM
MTTVLLAKDHLDRAVEVTINIGLLLLLAGTCFLILKPFIPLLAWGVILAVATYPLHRRLEKAFGGRRGLAATVVSIILVSALILPAIVLGETVLEGAQKLISYLKEGGITIPPPPASVATWPLIGGPLSDMWNTASTNLSAVLTRFAPQLKEALTRLLSASAGIGSAALQLILSIVVAGFLLANAAGGAAIARSFSNRLFGEKGEEFEHLAESTVRSVTTGIIGVAFIQTIFATIGFLVAGLPGAGVWSIAFLFAAVLQVGLLALIPAVIYVFVVASTTKAVIFLIWCAFVGLMDNVLKPLLLGRGVEVPIAIVFLGAIGGFISMGIIGLFIGAIVLSVGYKLFLAWLHAEGAPGSHAAKA